MLASVESASWDDLTTIAYRQRRAVAIYSEEKSCIVARTADPRLNPKAVSSSESSTSRRKHLDTIPNR